MVDLNKPMWGWRIKANPKRRFKASWCLGWWLIDWLRKVPKKCVKAEYINYINKQSQWLKV